MKLLWLTNIPSPYRLSFFEELSKHCELTVLFERSGSAERDSRWKEFSFRGYEGVLLEGVPVGADKAFSLKTLPYLKDPSFDQIVVSNFFTPTGMMAVGWLKAHGRPFYLESDGGFAREESPFKRWFKSLFVKGAKGYFSTGEAHDEYYLSYGATKDALIRYPFSSLTKADILPAPLSPEEKREWKRSLGVKEKQVALFVGQMIPRKGVDLILQAAARLPEIGFYLVGGELPSEFASLVSKDATNLHFVPFVVGQALDSYYQMADLLLLPSREDIWGLVVNEGMAKGLPVIASRHTLAGLELIKDGENGCLLDHLSATALETAIKQVLSSPETTRQMSKNNLDKIKGWTIEQMANRHLEILN